jgi:hypothetical protein
VIKNGYKGRRIFIAEDGFISLRPKALELGDHIYILAGLRVLLTLRLREQHYRLVGKAYIPRIINSKVVEE